MNTMDHLPDENDAPLPNVAALPSSPMRKVFSLDCVRRPPPSRSGRAYRNLVPPTGEDVELQWGLSLASTSRSKSPDSSGGEYDDVPSCKASKFSSSNNRTRRVSLPRTLSSTSLDRIRSAHSPDRASVVDLTNGTGATDGDVDAGGLPGTAMAAIQLRPSQILNLSILFFLFVATFADVAFDLRNVRAVSDGAPPPSRGGGTYHSPKLGSAMIGSVTTALSPILPFAGGVDLRRGENWGLEDDDGGADASASSRGWFGSSTLSGWLWQSTKRDAAAVDAGAKSLALSVASGIPRGGGTSNDAARGSGRTNRAKSSNGKRRSKRAAPRDPVLASSDPYLPTQDIADLTLGDVALAFEYAIESSRRGFDAQEFRSRGNDGEPLTEQMTQVVDAMDEAVARSRGLDILPAMTSPASSRAEKVEEEEKKEESDQQQPLSSDVGYGDVDALQFCAAMRLLAEWRLIRQVPEGYKGYAVGMGLGHKDVVQNVAKIEAAVHDLIDLRVEQNDNDAADMERRWDETSCQGNAAEEAPTCEAAAVAAASGNKPTPPREARSPTLREVLQYEIDLGVQNVGKLPRLKEKSAGMGLLWVRRQLQYQTEVFSNMLLVPDQYGSAIEAVRAAYSTVYDMFHGWAVQKIFNYSFQAAPEVDVIYRHMNPRKLEEVTLAAMNGEFNAIGTDDEGTAGSDGRDGIEEVQYASAAEEESIVTDSVMVTSSVGLGVEEADTISSGAFGIEGLLNVSSITEDSHAEAEANEDSRRVSNNPWVRFGLHVASEWDKLTTHVGGECDKLGKHVGGEWDKLVSNVGGEWDKLVFNVDKIFHHGKDGGARSRSPSDIRGGGGKSLSGDDLDRYLSDQMKLDAQRHIVRYLNIARPLLDDLAGLFDELNMDDPTKV